MDIKRLGVALKRYSTKLDTGQSIVLLCFKTLTFSTISTQHFKPQGA